MERYELVDLLVNSVLGLFGESEQGMRVVGGVNGDAYLV